MTTNLKTRQPLPIDFAVESFAPAIPSEPAPKGIYNSQHQALILGDKIGGGGEGNVYLIQGHTDLVAKIYHEPPAAEKVEKLLAVAKLGNDRLFKIAAWPVDILRDHPNGNVIGFVMKKIAQAAEVHTLHSPKSRLKKFPDASWAFLLHVATNITRAVATMHEHGFVIGDVNPKNILVTRQATVFLLDCDSFQFTAEGKTYRCGAGFPEYTPPELQGLTFADVDRTPEHDGFGLAVVIFQLLFLGRHPFSGRFLGVGEMPLEQSIRELRFAYGDDATTREMQPPPGTLPLAAIPAELNALFRRAFLESDRPKATEWLPRLEWFSQALQPCTLHSGHFYYAELTACPWCDLETRAGIRLFNFKLGEQRQPEFRLEALWAEIEELEQVKKLPSPQNISVMEPSAESLKYTQLRERVYWGGIALSAIMGLVIGKFSSFDILIYVGGLILIMLKVPADTVWHRINRLFLRSNNSSFESIVTQTQSRVEQLKTQLKQEELRLWGKENGEKEYFDLFNQLQINQHDYESLESHRANRLKQAALQIQTDTFNQFLRQFIIEGSGIIPPHEERQMREQGIVTAADIDLQKLQHKRGINGSALQKLLAWQQALATRYTHPVQTGLPPRVRLQIEAETDAERHRLEVEITRKTSTLRSLKQELEERRGQLLPTWTQTHLAKSQAELDLAEVSKENPMPLVIVVLLLSFLMPTFLQSDFVASFFSPGNSAHSSHQGKPPPPPKPQSIPDSLSSFDRYYNEGLDYLKKKDYRGAKLSFLNASPYMDQWYWQDRYSSFSYNLCLARIKLGEGQIYKDYLKNQLTVDPKRPDYRVQLIALYCLLNKNSLAVEEYQILKQDMPSVAVSLQREILTYGVNLDALEKPNF
jgi:DNA-binding helix-hairpin-helix protein with protein kinase domain